MKEPALEALQAHFPRGFVLVYVSEGGTIRLANWNPEKMTALEGVRERIESSREHVELEQLLDDEQPESREEV